MDSKNVIAAISLSAAVIILYSLFFAPPPLERNNTKIITESSNNNTDISSPTIDKQVEEDNISRKDSLNIVKRIKIENQSIIGSISLKGAVIDDIVFKNYTTELDSKDNVILLSPNQSQNNIDFWINNSGELELFGTFSK